jgi:hypothetical protein
VPYTGRDEETVSRFSIEPHDRELSRGRAVGATIVKRDLHHPEYRRIPVDRVIMKPPGTHHTRIGHNPVEVREGLVVEATPSQTIRLDEQGRVVAHDG